MVAKDNSEITSGMFEIFSDERPQLLLRSGLRVAYIIITMGVTHNILNYGTNFYIMYFKGTQIPRPVSVAIKLSMVSSNVSWSSVRNLFLLTILAHKIMKRLLDFWKTCALLMYINYKCGCGAHHTSRRTAEWHYNGSGRGRSPNRCSCVRL